MEQKLGQIIKSDYLCYKEFYGFEKAEKIKFLQLFKIIFTSPALWVLTNFRMGQWVRSGNYRIQSLLKVLYYIARFLSVVIVKIQISETAVLGENIFLSNKGGIIIGGTVGNDCIINNRVTIGIGKNTIPPVIGDNVCIGSNSLIYGDISIGDNIIVLSDSIVSKTIPSNCVVGGNPARIKRRQT